VAGRKINARQLAEDVRQGLHDNELMAKYELTSSQLRGAFKKILDAELVTREDLQERATRVEGSDRAGAKQPVPEKDPVGSGRDTDGLQCPQCGRTLEPSQQECPRCGILLAKIRPVTPEGVSDTEKLPPVTQQDKLVGYFYAEASEALESARKRRLWLVGSAVGILALSLLFSLIGYGKQVVLFHTLAVSGFIFVYYFVVLHYCFKESTMWGVLALCFSPAAILFVIIHWNTIFQGKILPKLWLALFVPLTLLGLFMKSAG
jgi:hypothetical protein